jgi:hypothetical protein
LQLSCTNSIIFAVQNKSCERAQAASARHEHAVRAARAQHEPRGQSPSSPCSCPNQAMPNLCRSDTIHINKSRYIELDQKHSNPILHAA